MAAVSSAPVTLLVRAQQVRRAVATFAVLVVCYGWADARTCTKSDERAALDAVPAASTWQQIYAAYRRYGHCDDGAIAEGFSDRVVHLLASDWESVSELGRMVAADAPFRAFVLRHIDETADVAELRQIAQSARTKCPTGLIQLCAALERAALLGRKGAP
jgi:hypothetical protein